LAITFKAEEIFQLAEQVEKNGVKFYRRAAYLHPDHRGFLEELAEMEVEHAQKFVELRQTLSSVEKGSAGFDPDQEAKLFLQTLAATHGGEGDPDVVKQLDGEESLAEIIETAIGLEKDTIIFYNQIIQNVPAEYGRDRVAEIIDQEKSHIVILSEKLKEV